MRFTKKILDYTFSRMAFQHIYRKMFDLGRLGLGFGIGGDFINDGELHAVNYAKQKITNKKLDNLIIMDVGANVGNYVKRVSEVFKNNRCLIYAFEPSIHTFNELRKNIQQQNIKPVMLALGNENAERELYYENKTSECASLYDRRLDHFGRKNVLQEIITVKRLDDFCDENNILRINFLKIDAEGNDYYVLKGAENLITKKLIDFIQFEFGGANIDSRTFFQDFFYLLSPSYTLYRIVKDGLIKIEKYTEDLEQFTTINYLAELKNEQI